MTDKELENTIAQRLKAIQLMTDALQSKDINRAIREALGGVKQQ